MKKLLAIVVLSMMSLAACASESQKVCIDKIGKDGKVVNGKDGKPQQECKMMKVHKKLEVEQTPKK
jgi:hypothetical protein